MIFIDIIKDLIDSHKTYFQLSILFILPYPFYYLIAHPYDIFFLWIIIMSNSSASSNSNANDSIPNVINHVPDNQVEQANNSPVDQTPVNSQQTNNIPDTNMEEAMS